MFQIRLLSGTEIWDTLAFFAASAAVGVEFMIPLVWELRPAWEEGILQLRVDYMKLFPMIPDSMS